MLTVKTPERRVNFEQVNAHWVKPVFLTVGLHLNSFYFITLKCSRNSKWEENKLSKVFFNFQFVSPCPESI